MTLLTFYYMEISTAALKQLDTVHTTLYENFDYEFSSYIKDDKSDWGWSLGLQYMLLL